MTRYRTTEDAYAAVRQVTQALELAGYRREADILDHRMTRVAWTTADELLDELKKVLSGILEMQVGALPEALSANLRDVLANLSESTKR